jgi:hypothetical protein
MNPSAGQHAEAVALLQLHDGRLAPAMAVISSHFSVIQARSQLLLTLATLTLTITGFSGPTMAHSGWSARIGMVLGLVLVLAGVILLLATLRATWLTKLVESDPALSLARMIAYRDGKTRTYRWQLTLLSLGLSSYVFAVVAYLLAQ